MAMPGGSPRLAVGTPSTGPPRRPPRVASRAGSPAALWPKRKFSPTTTARAARASNSTSAANTSAVTSDSSRVNSSTSTVAMPASPSSSTLRSRVVSRGGSLPGRSTASGCRSKVTAAAGRPLAAASAATRSSSARCPRWTPSNIPTVTTVGPRPSGTAATPSYRWSVTPAPPWGGPGRRCPGSPRPGARRARRRPPGRRGPSGRGSARWPGRTPRPGSGPGSPSRPSPPPARAPPPPSAPARPAPQGVGVGLAEPADGRAAQAGQVGQGAEGLAEVGGQGPDVGAARADHGQGGQGPLATGQAEQLQLVDDDRPGGPLDLLAPAGLGVQPLPADLDRRHHRRGLLLGAPGARPGGPPA